MSHILNKGRWWVVGLALITLGAFVKPVATADPPGNVALEAAGYVVPVREVQVGPRVMGQIVKANLDEGKHVKTGEMLAELDNTKYQIELDRAQAAVEKAKARLSELQAGARPEELAQAQAQVQAVEAEHLFALKDLKRARQLPPGGISREELEKMEARVSQAEAQLKCQKAALELVKAGPRKEQIAVVGAELAMVMAERQLAELNVSHTVIRAPMSGVILKKYAEVGDIVNPQVHNLSAMLCTMADLRQLEVEVDVSERDLARVFVGQKCKVRSEAFPDLEYKGQVSRIMPVANRSKATVSVRVKIELPEKDDKLRPEMRARVQFLAKE